MITWFHFFSPEAVLLNIGPVKLYAYGLILVGGMTAGLLVTAWLAEKFGITKEAIYDLAFWLIIWGIVGARIYHVGLEWPYYSQHLVDILKIWQGGLAIHGSVIAGALVIIIFSRRRGFTFWSLAGAVVPGLVLGQAIGRWGNYFNQELFGRPTDLPWGIFIEPARRVAPYLNESFFHPTFLYESVAGIVIFIFLMGVIRYFDNEKNNDGFDTERLGKFMTAWYLIGFGLYRFLVEFIKIDATPMALGLRWPQVVSLGLMVGGVVILIKTRIRE